MTKNNQTVVLLTSLVVAGLFSVAGGLIWLGFSMKSVPNPGSSPIPSIASSLPQSVPVSLDQVKLASDRNVNYSKLQANLQQKDWKAGDQETYERLLEAAGPQAQALGYTPQAEMDTFPCADLKTVDQLWSAASQGKLGFSSQQRILRAIGDYREMYDQVGWQKRSGEWMIGWSYSPETRRMTYKSGLEPNFTNPPPGHLPTVERGYNFNVSLNAALDRCGF